MVVTNALFSLRCKRYKIVMVVVLLFLNARIEKAIGTCSYVTPSAVFGYFFIRYLRIVPV